MRPLLWKEMRELRLWVVAGALLVGAFETLSHSESFQRSFEGGYLPIFMPVLLTIAAVGLGAGQIARERHARSLDYLLTRPISPTAIVWAKFLAGTIALALLVVALVGFGFKQPFTLRDSGERMIREQVGFQSVALALFPRYWLVYALTLFFSALVDRAAKVAAMMTAIAITVVALASSFVGLAPFSRFVYWLPFFDASGALVTVARSAALSAQTGAIFSAAAVLLTALAAVLLKRSPERYVGNPGLIAIAAGLAGAAALSAHAASVRFPVTAPVGSWSIEEPAGNDDIGVVAHGDMAGVILDHQVRFVDFSNPSKPLPTGDVAIPLFNSDDGAGSAGMKAAMGDRAVFVVGHKKAVPVDVREVVMIKPAGELRELVLGPVRIEDFVSSPVLVDHFLYLGFIHELQCDLRVFDTESQRELAPLRIDRLAPSEKGGPDAPDVTLYSRDGYLYVASSASLTAVDVRQPAHPVAAGRVEFHPQAKVLRDLPRYMAWQGDRLFEASFWPAGLLSYDLRDPSHPVAASGLVWRGVHLTGSGKELYQPWRQGVLEFRADGDELRGQRYLSGGGRSIAALAMGARYLFALTDGNEQHQLMLQAYR